LLAISAVKQYARDREVDLAALPLDYLHIGTAPALTSYVFHPVNICVSQSTKARRTPLYRHASRDAKLGRFSPLLELSFLSR